MTDSYAIIFAGDLLWTGTSKDTADAIKSCFRKTGHLVNCYMLDHELDDNWNAELVDYVHQHGEPC